MKDCGGQLGLFGAEEAVVLRHSARARRLSLRVFPHGLVEVVAPPGAGARSVRRFLSEHAEWIARARSQYRLAEVPSSLEPPARIALVALGEQWSVDYLPGPRRLKVRAATGGGLLQVLGADDQHWRRRRLRAWLMDRARATLLPWLAEVSAETGLEYAGATVRRQRSRWGSCSARRTLSLNCALLFVEPELVRQLFVHELAHTRHLDHSRRFWRLVESLEPEYEDRERRLRDAWRSVPAWVNYDPG